MNFLRLLLLLLLLPGSTSALWAQETPTAIVGARILTAEGRDFDPGLLLFQHGRLLFVGAPEDASLPAQTRVLAMPEAVLMPGLVDTHSHLGKPSGGDSSDPIQPGARVLDSLDIRDTGFRRALAGGLTTLNVMPGSGHLISGQTVYLKPRSRESLQDCLLWREDGQAAGGLKMANGTNSQKKPPFPGTRGKSAALVRQAMIRAKEYAENRRRAEAKGEALPLRDLDLEALSEALEGRRIVHHHTHRHDDILTVMRLAQEFGFQVVLHHVSEAWKVAEELAAAQIPCSVILVDSPGGKLEASEIRFEAGAILERAGVKVAFHSDDPITDCRLFLRMAAFAVRAGMTRKGAIQALTLHGAEMLDLDHRLGSLKAGKDADFIVLNGDPFSTYTQVQQTWIEGKKVFDRRREEDRLYAEGGYGAGNPEVLHMCCFGEEERP
ncbi:MAG: amidohydrolase [Planctomycetota bacterium]|nr:MAG: amidohydrolase [Planctomycetota bacterium]